MATKLTKEWISISKVKDIGKYKLLVTFSTKEDMKKALSSGMDFLKSFFADIRRWSMEEVGQTRRVWLHCQGIPLHEWSLISPT